jgi:hypothetical protein
VSPEAGAPAIEERPPPWELQGRGLIVAARFSDEFLAERAFVRQDLGVRRGRHGLMMYVDYSKSDVGPYQELLFVPGKQRFADRRWHPTISRILVSTQASVEAGRRNWGIPKERADFQATLDDEGGGEVLVEQDGRFVASFSWKPGRVKLPVTTLMLTRPTYTLGQELDGRTFVFAPRARGRIRKAKLGETRFDGGVFPDLNAGKVASVWEVTTFKMRFPIPKVIE